MMTVILLLIFLFINSLYDVVSLPSYEKSMEYKWHSEFNENEFRTYKSRIRRMLSYTTNNQYYTAGKSLKYFGFYKIFDRNTKLEDALLSRFREETKK